MVGFIGLTFAGDTSGIITKGIGPRPTAKDLHKSYHSGLMKVLGRRITMKTYITNVTIATLGRIVAPEFSPQPTAKSEIRTPNVEILRSCFVPKQIGRAHV